jgi:hypothetical protein
MRSSIDRGEPIGHRALAQATRRTSHDGRQGTTTSPRGPGGSSPRPATPNGFDAGDDFCDAAIALDIPANLVD